MSNWKDKHVVGLVQFDFEANGQFQIGLKAGEKVEIFKESSGWYKGQVIGREAKGIFPVSYIEITTEAPPTKRAPKAAATAPAAAGAAGAAKDAPKADAAAKPGAPATAAAGAGRSSVMPKAAPKADTAADPKAAPATPTNGDAKPTRPVPQAPPAAAAKPADKKENGTPASRNAPAPIDTATPATPTGAAKPTLPPVKSPAAAAAPATAAATTPKSTPAVAPATPTDKKTAPVAAPKVPQRDSKDQKRRTPSMDGGSRPSGSGGALIGDDVPKKTIASAEALYTEVAHCMREWDISLKQALVAGNSLEYHRTKERMVALLELRSKVMSDAIPENKREELRQEIIQLIEGSRKMQEGYMVPRNPVSGELADDRNTGVMELLGLHRVMYSTLKEEASSMLKQKAEARRAAGQQIERMKGAKVVKKLKLPTGYLQLYLDVKMCIFSVGEATEVLVSLFSNQDNKFITEDYVIQLTAAGMPENRAKIGKLMTIFKDLEARDFDRDLWLVCKIFRKGVLVSDDIGKNDKKKPDEKALYRRPFGCAATSLSGANFDELMGKEYQPPNAAMTIYMPKEETQFFKIHEMIIKGDKNLEAAPRAKGVALGLTLFSGDLKGLRTAEAKRLGDEKDVPVSSKLDFPEVMDPGDARNDFYVMLLGGTFLQDGKKSAKNIEILVSVRNLQGETIENCIYTGSGDGGPIPEYRTTVYYHSNTPQYNELLCLRLSPDQLSKAHLFFTYWHVSSSKKSAPFAFSYLKLTTDVGAAVPDQVHKMETFKPFSKMEQRKSGENGYLKTGAAAAKFGARAKELFQVSTRLVSTKKTQNVTLHGLSQWRETEAKVVKEFLGTFHVIRDVHEFLKFSRETFTSFFGMLASDKYESVHEQVFKAILHSINLLHDRNVKTARSVLRQYITDIFAEPAVYLTLLRLATKVLSAAKAASDVPEVVRLLCLCLHSMLKFVVKSRDLALASGKPSADDKTYKNEVQNMFRALGSVAGMESKSDNLKPAHLALVTSIPIALKVLKPHFSAAELGAIARGVLQAVPPAQALNKLNLTHRLLKGTIGEDKEAREVVFPELLTLLQVHLRSIDQCVESTDKMDEIYLCIAILCRLFKIMETDAAGGPAVAAGKAPASPTAAAAGAEKMYELTALIKDILNVVAMTQRSQSGEIALKAPSEKVSALKVDLVVDSLTVLWSILHSMTDAHFDKYFNSLPKPTLKLILAQLLDISKTSIGLNLYPELWIVMTMLQLSTIATLHKNVAKPLTQWFIKSDADFAPELWQAYLELTLEMIGCDNLQLDKFSQRKHKFIDERYGDLRDAIIQQFPPMWKVLGPRAVQFSGVLVPVLFDLASNYPIHLKEFAVDIYFQLLCREFDTTGQVGTVERHTIDSLYNIANHNQALGETFMNFLFSTLTKKFESHNKLAAQGQEFLTHVKRMYDYMASLLRFPDTALYEDERNSVALKLIHYLETSGHVRKEMYTRYVQYLVDLHASLKNYVEAGVTQGLQIKMLEWTDEVLEAFANYPKESERQRRERLYKSAIHFFVQGEDYERAIARCDELRQYYQFESYEYDKLSEILAWQSDYFKKIITAERFYSSYFRVVYYGQAFSEEIRDREFIYRGVKLENVMDFTNRLKRKFPEAKIIPSSDKPADDVLAATPQVITITTLTRANDADLAECADVAPVALARASKPQAASAGGKPDLKTQPSAVDTKEAKGSPSAAAAAAAAAAAEQRGNKRIPAPVRKYRENDSIRAFYYAKGIQKSKDKKPANEFKDLWVSKTFVFASDSFPSTRRRVEIGERKDVTLTPIQNAIATMQNKNREFAERMDAVDSAPAGPVDVGPLSMLLNGMIDAAVNGGTGKYIEAFLGPDFKAENDGAKRHQSELRQSLRDQIALLKKGLTVFAARRSADLKGLNDHLNGFFDQMVKKTESVVIG